MPKGIRAKSSALYDHRTRNIVARQLNISRNASGRSSSYSYTSTQIRLKQVEQHPQVHTDLEQSAADAGCDDSGDQMVSSDAAMDEDLGQAVECPVDVMPVANEYSVSLSYNLCTWHGDLHGFAG